MELGYRNCRINIEETFISCVYERPYGVIKWRIDLDENEICYTEGKKRRSFHVDEINEFQFEMLNGGSRYGDIPACNAYVILKNDPEPQEFFYFMVSEEYTLMNETKAYDYGTIILNQISKKYNIANFYKLSIDTKKKQGGVGLVFLILILIVVWLLFESGVIKLF
ncbi:hypothetical protein [Mucilaginibacter sp. L3T2-6]|uniref:hypothetical protein n=1 Tax=Mucilaginibacter sp. L3T2-6 TaxID=3062491 RepID=UPI002675E2C1|nr:hypothetical protein [Mucilaginibacter sp. L3T2-6]MDO3641418.1 hypothetical protein [Mucilaginibacter sp. L3T2-6]MDV6213821.1 hypothetical protein [Mucilaginibacter sp. L3T2-6]